MYLFSVKLKGENNAVEYKKFVAECSWELMHYLMNNYGNYEIEYINKEADVEIINK